MPHCELVSSGEPSHTSNCHNSRCLLHAREVFAGGWQSTSSAAGAAGCTDKQVVVSLQSRLVLGLNHACHAGAFHSRLWHAALRPAGGLRHRPAQHRRGEPVDFSPPKACQSPLPLHGPSARLQHDCTTRAESRLLSNVSIPAQVTASFEFMPLPGAMFGDPADKAFRPAPRWATVSPEQVHPKEPCVSAPCPPVNPGQPRLHTTVFRL